MTRATGPARRGPRVPTFPSIAGIVAVVAACGPPPAEAPIELPGFPVTAERLSSAQDEPGNWLMYSGTYSGQRFSTLDLIHRGNVANLEIAWVFQLRHQTESETTPLVVNGVMYVTQPYGDVIALDARTGKEFWWYRHPRPDRMTICCGEHIRGAAVLGDRVYVGTLDARLIALDASDGRVLWNAEVGRPEEGYSITSAPLAVKDRIIVGVGGGEYGIRGYLDAYDAETGERVWRTYTIPGPGEFGNDTWKGDSWRTGGAPTWLTGSYDPELDLVYWGTGNPGPDFAFEQRAGDNLYSDCVLAIDPDDGRLVWYFQFTPGDMHDWDATEIPVLADIDWNGQPRQVMLFANRNAFFYVLDRATGEFLQATEYAKQTWAERIDENGRPVRIPGKEPSTEGVIVWPAVVGATNWWSPSYSPRTGLHYVKTLDAAGIYMTTQPAEYSIGEGFFGSAMQAVPPGDSAKTALRAIDPQTGAIRWEYEMITPAITPAGEDWAQYLAQPGILTTAGDLVISGAREGDVFALDAHTGELLWRKTVGGQLAAAPITWLADGQQYITMAAGTAIFTFRLRSRS